MTITTDTTTTTSFDSTTDLATARSAMWVLRLLYAPVDGQHGVATDGRRRLWNGLLIAADTLDHECDTTMPVEFTSDKWGVVVDNFDDILSLLESDNLIRRAPSEDYDAQYTLTYDGLCTAAELYSELPETEQEVLAWTRNRHMQRDSAALLSFIYQRYFDSNGNLTFS